MNDLDPDRCSACGRRKTPLNWLLIALFVIGTGLFLYSLYDVSLTIEPAPHRGLNQNVRAIFIISPFCSAGALVLYFILVGRRCRCSQDGMMAELRPERCLECGRRIRSLPWFWIGSIVVFVCLFGYAIIDYATYEELLPVRPPRSRAKDKAFFNLFVSICLLSVYLITQGRRCRCLRA